MGEVIRGVPFGQKKPKGDFTAASGTGGTNFFTQDERIAVARLFQLGKTSGLFVDQETSSAKDSFSYAFYGSDSKGTKVLLSVITKIKETGHQLPFSFKGQYPSFDGKGPLGLKSVSGYLFEGVEHTMRSAILATVTELGARKAKASFDGKGPSPER